MNDLNYQNLVLVYVLKLENSKYYVGFTQDIKTRFMNAMQGTGAQFTIDHAPISIDKLLLVSRKNARLLIDEIVIKLRNRYGKDSVRGGAFSQYQDPDGFLTQSAYKNFKSVDHFINHHNRKFKNTAIKAKEVSFREAVALCERMNPPAAMVTPKQENNSTTSSTETNGSKFVMMPAESNKTLYQL